MTEQGLDTSRAAKVRIEIVTNDGRTFEAELADCDFAQLDIERDIESFSTDGLAAQWLPMLSGQVNLRAHGTIVKTGRRQT